MGFAGTIEVGEEKKKLEESFVVGIFWMRVGGFFFLGKKMRLCMGRATRWSSGNCLKLKKKKNTFNI